MGKKSRCDKKTFFDSFQALSPAFKLRTKGIDETYYYDETKIRVLSYEPLNNRDLLLLLSLLAFCKPNGVVGIPDGLRGKMNLKWDYESEGLTVNLSWRKLAEICGLSWNGQLKAQLKKSLFRLWGIGFHTMRADGKASAWHLLAYEADNDRVEISINPRLAQALNLQNPTVFRFVVYNLDIMKNLSKIGFFLLLYLSARLDEGGTRTFFLETIKHGLWQQEEISNELERKRTHSIRTAFKELSATGLWEFSEDRGTGRVCVIRKKRKWAKEG